MVKRLRDFLRSKNDTQSVPLQVDSQERIYAVGDIHGRADLLNQMLREIGDDIATCQDARVPRLVFLGDYIDRGDQSRETLDFLLRLKDRLPDGSVDLLAGNHEAAVLSFLSDPVGSADWLKFGGLQTLGSYGVSPPKSFPEISDLVAVSDALRVAMGKHLDFLASMSPMTRSGNVVFVHAGLNPDLELDAQEENAMLWGQSGFIDRGGIDGYRVVHGHYEAKEAVVTPRRICVDTGAFYSGRLTAVRLDQGEKLLRVNATDFPC